MNKMPTMQKGNRKNLYSKRLMMLLDNEKLAALEEEFGEH